MKYRGIFEYEYPTEHKSPVSIDVHLHGDCVKGKIIEWEYRPLEQEPRKGNWIGIDEDPHEDWECDNCGFVIWADENIEKFHYCPNCGCHMVEPQKSEEQTEGE